MFVKKMRIAGDWLHGIFLKNIARWLVFGLLVGILSGLAASGFYYLLHLARHFCLHLLAGYAIPAPAGEQLFSAGVNLDFRPFVFFILPACGGLLCGWIIYRFAPETAGAGTDAMIDAFHNKKGQIRTRVPFVKTITSLLTLASGGSGGRQGPIAQIGAGIGSTVARLLKLNDKERRILLVAGCAGGLSAIFRAPLGGAITSIEILYKEDWETEALVPAVVSSITAYIIFTSIFGNSPIFFFPEYTFSDPRELIFYVLLGFICIPAGILFIKVFHSVKDRVFIPLNIPNYYKPAIGGLVVGFIGVAFPQVYGDGWEWIQMAILGKMGIGLMIALVLMKIIATSFTISSGGSGGIFGPTLFIGAMIGGALGFSANYFFPEIVTHPGAYVVVGMSAFFAGVANAPIGTLLMCSEMTRGYGLIAPLMLVSIIAILFTRKHSILTKQVQSRFHSPSHTADFTINIFAETLVKDFYQQAQVRPIKITTTYGQLKNIFSESHIKCFPVYNDNDMLIGALNWEHARSIVFAEGLEDLIIAQDMMVDAQTITPDNNFYDALIKFMDTKVEELLVVNTHDANKVLGVLRYSDLIASYHSELNRRKNSC